MGNMNKDNVKRTIQDLSKGAADAAYNGGGNHLYEYAIEFKDGYETDCIITVLSSQVYTDFDYGDTPTITFDDFFDMLYKGQVFKYDSGLNTINYVDNEDKSFVISGAGENNADNTLIMSLHHKQIF